MFEICLVVEASRFIFSSSPSFLLNQSAVSGLTNSSDINDDVIICDITNEDEEFTVDSTRVVDEG